MFWESVYDWWTVPSTSHIPLSNFRWLATTLRKRSTQILNISVFQTIGLFVKYLSGKHGEQQWQQLHYTVAGHLASNALSVLRFKQTGFCSRYSSEIRLEKWHDASILMIVPCLCISCDITSNQTFVGAILHAVKYSFLSFHIYSCMYENFHVPINNDVTRKKRSIHKTDIDFVSMWGCWIRYIDVDQN